MILWTVEPLERVFPPKKRESEYIEIDGGFLEIVKNKGKSEVSRLVSTDPRLYLEEKYSPGRIRN